MAGVVNLGRLLTETARRWPDRIGLVQGDRRWTWRQINERVDRTVIALRRLDVGEGDRIVIQSRNNVALFESPWVAFKLGAIWVPTNFRQAPAEIAYVARSSGARVFLYDAGFEQHVDAARAAQPGLEVVVALSTPPRAGEHGHEALIGSVEGFRPASEAEPIEAEVVEDDAAWFFYTSGTTGRPKAAELTHAQLAFVVNNHLADLLPGLGPDDASLVVAPLSHGAGIHAMMQVARGTRSVLTTSPRLDPEEAWRLVEEHRVTNMFTVPTIVKALVEHEAVDRHDHTSLRHVIYAGAPMYRADQKRALQKLGKVLVQYYGLGEVTGNITWLPAELHSLEDDGDGPAPLNTCGFARTGMEVAVMDEHGVRQEAGVTGEVCVRGPAVFKGYYDDPAANAKAFRNGWFRTGDLGHLDGRGFLFITGRASDMFISGGSNVYPREIEEVLLTHPRVREAAVVGVPDPQWGEVGLAVLVTAGGAAIDPAELRRLLDGRLARYKHPKRFVFWDSLPRSAYGKVAKKIVLERLAERGELPPAPPAPG